MLVASSTGGTRRVVVLAAVSLASVPGALALAAQPAAAAVRDCPTSRPGIYDVSARNMACRTALRKIRQARYVGRNSTTARVSGWSCMTVSTYEEGATFRCISGGRAFRWTAGG